MLHKFLHNKNVILASGSPRRQQYLKELDIDFEIRLKNIEEIYPEELKAHEITNYLAKLKAAAFASELKPTDILITSDTLVWLENEALGKPKDTKDAIAMIAKMSGKTHEVITSVCIKSLEKEIVFYEVTEVSFKKLSLEEITYYVEKYQPLDKAGAYGIQEWIGLVAIEKMNGSYSNVVGLPTQKLYNELLKFVQ
jgi:septum formation protein